MDAAEWDEHYAATELVWGAPPNETVVEQVFGLERRLPTGGFGIGEPRPELPRALDLGCGEGRNTLWLATHGWQVDAVDFSQTGIDKGRTVASRLSRSVRGRIHWIHANVTELAAADVTGPYELILIAFLHLPAADRRALLLRAVDMLAPEGTLLIIGNDTLNLAEGYGGEQNPALTFTPADILADLAPAEPDIRVRLADRVHRPTESRDAIDALVVATKPAPEPPAEQPALGGVPQPPALDIF
ncbi:class I SAM-dependent methyltransferase [Nocardia seriolae]|uniref:Methyltransferase domain-containing protein n=1 Tax=Nocardia seriolae TaxID=37332 RepID=A0A0B8N7Y3_9NOCA|nr:class I SAM-dependent methyltransferase [Nocardia seriolae]MTJ66762.1 methyltransferase domain-containing protein [Nocardia seriolae]MTJ70440.1 methyltransferase domain-containing protein [Nocardia seriolae]MTJ85402.1 methyltransferase domain-containing protein [Nocardia seriolae]MTK29399.1 methyltransferase domain-containing protein [Nocardia seriolae]MTK44694.1 methyltransferase domain-containing protein [Nocardia seriolae]